VTTTRAAEPWVEALVSNPDLPVLLFHTRDTPETARLQDPFWLQGAHQASIPLRTCDLPEDSLHARCALAQSSVFCLLGHAPKDIGQVNVNIPEENRKVSYDTGIG